MRLKDPRTLHRLMVIQGVSRRQLATAAGWGSHGLLNRLLDPKDKFSSVTPERAVRIAAHLRVATEDLFTLESSTTPAGHTPNATARVAK